MPKLVRPAIQYKDSFIQAAREFAAEGHSHYKNMNFDDLDANFADYVAEQLQFAKTPSRPEWVPDTIFWLVEGDEFLGQLSIRHYLSGALIDFGGHIGYEIAPSQRGKGYGKLQLQLALPIARDDLNLEKVLLTCDVTNIGSQKIIEANGGIHQDTHQTEFSAVPTMRWWIDLKKL